MQECDFFAKQCTAAMDLSPPPLYPPTLSTHSAAAACESSVLLAESSSSSPIKIAMPPLETSKMSGLTGGPASNMVAAAVGAGAVGGISGGATAVGLSDHHHHHLLLAAVGGGGAAAAKKPYAEQTDSELAELATQEISLDLQGLIDDTHFADENLFGDLMETAKKNEAGGQSSWLAMARVATPGSSSGGSSGQNSPGSEGQNSPTSYGGGYHHRSSAALAYLPGSVHSGASFAQLNGHVTQQQQQQQQQQHHHHHQNIQVKHPRSDSC
jgi:hypothetical protein